MLSHYRKLGFFLSHNKIQSGTVVEFLGYQLNFSDQTIRIKPATLEKTLTTIRTSFSLPHDNFGLQIQFDDLEILLGRLEFLANISLVGRTKTSNLVAQLRQSRRNSKEPIILSSASYQELIYWHSYCQNPTLLPFFRDNVNLYELSFSDAAGGANGKWAYFKGIGYFYIFTFSLCLFELFVRS